ncbi:hypothetical protein NZK35_19725 [Stieleria sp. ICT_E10.1]|uniref:hypothetical protein n=1 Tax=Stieleria sedimenti TaxID=2976331 RepID=UPI0021802A65|nr:hypothetical protein [Stieleria sedimenti]MCS7468888.1 hypothetical protein [Stieleria sedimenti]
MRTRTPLGRLVLTAMLAGSFSLAGQSQAKSDFDALLADVNFDNAPAAALPAAAQPAPIRDAATTLVDGNVQAVVESRDVVADVTELTTTPAAEAMTMPADSEALPAPPIAEPIVDEQAPAAAVQASACCHQCTPSCGKHCRLAGLKHRDFIQPGACQPYMPPQLPTSTFYQYWRSNACNVHVWDGYRNQCKPHIDLSIHGKSHGCNNGCDNGCHRGGCAAPPVDCGPPPAEWAPGNAQ